MSSSGKKDQLNRRTFVKATLAASVGATLGGSVRAEPAKAAATQIPSTPRPAEWRNRQSDMAYRSFGRTGMMVSEIVQGTALWKGQSELDAFDTAFERGVNYIDMAPAYQGGKSEKLLGQYLKESGNRDHLFISDKISFYDEFFVRMMNDILKGLPEEKKKALRKEADDLIERRRVLQPGYHFYYWPKQADKLYATYLRYVVLRDYGNLRKHKGAIKKRMHELVDNSLRTTGAGHFDVLHCPHGVAMPEMLDDENIPEVMAELKAAGKIRFAALSMHNDVTGNLGKAVELGHYDGAMAAYNIGNHASLETTLAKAGDIGMGFVAMKVANLINPGDAPSWRLDKLNTIIEDDSITRHAKSYLWALQNPHVSCCVSDMITPTMVAENTSIVGRKVDLQVV